MKSNEVPETAPGLRNHRVTVRDIGREVGLHYTTVAEALRDSPRVKEATKRLVRKAADRLGYKVDPMLSALSAYRTVRRAPVYQGTLAWINGFPSRNYFKSGAGFYHDCFVGAQERSEALGYRLESFWMQEPGMTPQRASQILQSRDAAGVIVGPMPHGVDELDLFWEKFCSVRIGYSLRNSDLTTIISDQFGNQRLLFERLRSLGFRRIGFACPRLLDERVNRHWSGSYRALQLRFQSDCELPIFLDDRLTGSPEGFLHWYRTYRPEVIITGGGATYLNLMRNAGIDVPGEVQIVSLHADNLGSEIAGTTQNGRIVGMVSVDHLIGIVHRFKVGIETHPKTVTIMGEWKAGASLNADLLSTRAVCV